MTELGAQEILVVEWELLLGNTSKCLICLGNGTYRNGAVFR